MARLRTGATEIEYVVEGTPGQPWLVLHHSLGANRGLWAPQVRQLGAHFAILNIDGRGHGGSSVPPGPYAIADFGRDALAVMDHVGVRRAAFCGLSLGSMVGLWLALEAPERFARMVLVGASAGVDDKSGFDRRLARLAEVGLEGIIDELLARWFTPPFLTAGREEVAAVRRMVLGAPLAGYAASSMAVRDFDVRERLVEITTPLLLITGVGDVATPPADAERIAAGVAGAQLEIIEGASHLVQVERAEVFDALLAEFLLEGAGSGRRARPVA
ncbi:MAG: 3-oxoadipate enol-lactonase [Rhizobiales bacterium]|nr:3-oxoadipate enol-lactonase [Hyphomicrobiales bacterium]